MIDIERFSEVARFVRVAVEAGAHFQRPPLNPQGRTGGRLLDWERNIDITLTYYFGKFEGQDNNRSFPGEEVGKIFPGEKGSLTRERVRQIVTKTVGQLYYNCPVEVQAQYDLNILRKQIGKPKFMTFEEGTTRGIVEDIEVGETNKHLNKRYYGLYRARTILAPFGIIVPFSESRGNTNTDFLTEQFQKVGPDTDKKILKQLLGQVDFNFMHSHRDIYDKYFVGLTKLLRDLGFHFQFGSGELNLFLERMNYFDIPFGHMIVPVKDSTRQGRLNYYFILRTQEEEISQSLLSDTDLAKFLHNPIVQISGIRVNKMPNTYDLEKRKDFRGVMTLCRGLKVRAERGGFKMEDFLKGCLFPTFRYTHTQGKMLRRRYFYPVAYQEHLADFLQHFRQ